MKVLIVEDELPAARQLSKLLLAQDPGIRILETLDSVESSVQWLRVFSPPDLLFLDVQLADGLSFDIFNQVEVRSPVIFTTAFDQYAIQAFKVNAVDYLLKPVDPEELAAALVKTGKRKIEMPGLESLARFFQPQSYKERFLVKAGQQFIFLLTADIAFFMSSQGLTQAHGFDGKKHFIDHALDDLEHLLNPKNFFRISRHLIVGAASIRKIFPHLNGRLKLELEPKIKEDVFVSRERVSSFKIWLGG